MSILVEGAIELGKVLLKVELSKHATGADLRGQGGSASERIVVQKIGKFWNQQNIWDRPDGLVVVTTQRLAFLAREQAFTATTDFLSFPFAAMANLKTARIMGMSPAIQFDVGGKPFVFTLFSGAEEVRDAITQQARAA